MAVAVVGVVERQRPPTARELSVAILEERGGPIDVFGPADPELDAATEQVQLLQFETRGALSALATERDPGVERPNITGLDLDVDDAVP